MSPRRRLPIGPRHPLYPILALVALAGIAFGPVADDAEDLPEERTHPYFPDHFWPYPILAMATLVLVGWLAYAGRPELQPVQAADPRAVVVPHPDWYFLFLFQLLKLGPALVTSVLVPAAVVLGLLLWPLIEARFGPPLARLLGWRSWPVPGRNLVTATMWLGAITVIAALTIWALLPPQACIPWFFNGPVCGG